MAEQNGLAPIAKAGILPNNDYADYPSPQDLYNAMMAYMEISVEAGETGSSGSDGSDGSDGGKTWGLVLVATIPVPALVSNIDVPVATADLTDKILKITAPEGQSTIDDEVFGVGVIEDGAITQTVHFLFNRNEGNNPTVVRTGWSLEIWEIGEIV